MISHEKFSTSHQCANEIPVYLQSALVSTSSMSRALSLAVHALPQIHEPSKDTSLRSSVTSSLHPLPTSDNPQYSSYRVVSLFEIPRRWGWSLHYGRRRSGRWGGGRRKGAKRAAAGNDIKRVRIEQSPKDKLLDSFIALSPKHLLYYLETPRPLGHPI
jgi:hypothetical protein